MKWPTKFSKIVDTIYLILLAISLLVMLNLVLIGDFSTAGSVLFFVFALTIIYIVIIVFDFASIDDSTSWWPWWFFGPTFHFKDDDDADNDDDKSNIGKGDEEKPIEINLTIKTEKEEKKD